MAAASPAKSPVKSPVKVAKLAPTQRNLRSGWRTPDGRAVHYVVFKPIRPRRKETVPQPCVIHIPGGNHTTLGPEETFWQRSGLLDQGWIVIAILNGPDTCEPFFRQNGWTTEVIPDFLTWLSGRYMLQGKAHLVGQGNGARAAFDVASKNPSLFQSLVLINGMPCPHGGVGLPPKSKLVKLLFKMKEMSIIVVVGSMCEDMLPSAMRVAGAVNTMGLQPCIIEVVQGASTQDILLAETLAEPTYVNHLATDLAQHLSEAHASQILEVRELAQKHGPYLGHEYHPRGPKGPLRRKKVKLGKIDLQDLSSETHMAILATAVDYNKGVAYMFDVNPPHDPCANQTADESMPCFSEIASVEEVNMCSLEMPDMEATTFEEADTFE